MNKIELLYYATPKHSDSCLICEVSEKFSIMSKSKLVGDRRNLISTHLNEYWNTLKFVYIKNEENFDDVKFFERYFL